MSKIIFQNASILVFLQLASYVVPFLLLPYLSRTLGVEAFGELAALWSVSVYAQILIDFGFYLWALKECALIKEDKKALSTLWLSVAIVKISLSLFVLVLMAGLSFLLASSFYLYFFMWLSVLSQALVPSWLFYGTQKVKALLFFSLFAQICGAFLTLLFVRSPSDLLFATLSPAVSWLFFTIVTNWYVYKNFSLLFSIPSLKELKVAVLGARHMFETNVAVAVYANFPAFILSLFGSKNEIAVFMGAQRITSAFSGLFSPILSAVYPKIAELTKNNVKYADSFLKKMAIIIFFGMGSLALILVFFSDFIVLTAFGEGFEESADMLKIMGFGPLFVALSSLSYSGYIVARGLAPKTKEVFFKLSAATIAASPVAIYAAKNYGAAFLYVAIEATIFFWLALKIRKWRRDGTK